MTKIEKGAVEPKIDNKSGLFNNAPEANHKESKHSMLKLFGSILTSAVWFLLIWFVAVGLGWAIHWTDNSCDWVSKSMIDLGHWLEFFLFCADALCLVVAVLKHVWAFILGRR